MQLRIFQGLLLYSERLEEKRIDGDEMGCL